MPKLVAVLIAAICASVNFIASPFRNDFGSRIRADCGLFRHVLTLSPHGPYRAADDDGCDKGGQGPEEEEGHVSCAALVTP